MQIARITDRQISEVPMRLLVSLVLALGVLVGVEAQSPEPPLADTRLTVHTLLREDLFAGFLAKDMTRFERGERNVERLLADRPDQRGNVLAWKGLALMHRAVLAHEAGQADEFSRQLQAARAAFAEAARQTSGNDGVAAITGGTYSVFADRLPEPHRAAAWADAYTAYSMLWQQQGAVLAKLPVHHRGEVIGGLVQSAQRTGRSEEVAQHLDRMLTLVKDTPYEATAQQWKDNPSSATTTKLTCKNCHNPGRLSSTLAALQK
jgi:hypothetical protein